MLMTSHVIVPLDGSTNAEAILPHALFFARETQSALTLLRVIMPPGEPEYGVPYIPDDWYAGEVMWTRNYLGGLAARLESQGVSVNTQYVEGVSAGGAITAYAVQHPDTRLIALASNGRSPGGLLLFGNVTGNVFATAPTSLLLMHPARNEQLPPGSIKPASYQTIVAPLDGTATSKQALERATTLALDCHATLLLVAPMPIQHVEEKVLLDKLAESVTGEPEDEEKKRSDILEGQAVQLRSITGLTVETAVDDGKPTTFVERFFGQDQQHVLIVTTREQAERKVLSFLHRSNAPVLFLHTS
jgi:nucleotide-binding universal stress UspA family protein